MAAEVKQSIMAAKLDSIILLSEAKTKREGRVRDRLRKTPPENPSWKHTDWAKFGDDY